MAKITIGKQFKEEFNSIYRMAKGGGDGRSFISKDVNIIYASPTKIIAGNDEYDYDDGNDGFNSSSGAKSAIGIYKNGASWFAAMRREKVSEELINNGKWKTLIEAVAADYHKNYSFIEFVQQKDEETKRTERKIAANFKAQVLSKLYPGRDISDPIPVADRSEDIYGLNLRLEIGSGVGETEPILCKVYFSKSRGIFRALSVEEAKKIDLYFNKMSDDTIEQEDKNIGREEMTVIDDALVAFGKLLKENKFSSHAYFGEPGRSYDIKTDMDRVNELLDRLANSDVKTLECYGVKVLGISHVQWENAEFKIVQNGIDALRLSIGLNYSVNLSCANCRADDGALIVSNEIVANRRKIMVDPFKENFGLSEDDFENIRKNSAFQKHLMTVSCPDLKRGERLAFNCSRIVCESQRTEIEKGVFKCKSCLRPEIVYKDIFSGSTGADAYKYTPSLGLAHDARELVPRDTLRKCVCCGRTFSKSELFGDECRVCRYGGGDLKEAKKRYSRYKTMLNPAIRLLHAFSTRKYCNEDEDIVVFILDKEKYVFEKVNAKDTGYMPKPVKARRSK